MKCIDVLTLLNEKATLQTVEREGVNTFRKKFREMLQGRKPETEEYYKNLISDFLKGVFYNGSYTINVYNQKGSRCDLAISEKDVVKVMFEVKAPQNKREMLTLPAGELKDIKKVEDDDDEGALLFSDMKSEKSDVYVSPLNRRAFAEILYYYINERASGNYNVTHLVITNFDEWYIFDARDFDSVFFQNKDFMSEYEAFHSKKTSNKKMELFYNEIAPKYIPLIMKTNATVIKFTTAEIEAHLDNDEIVARYYKVLSPNILLKKAYLNDSNTLNKDFYNELLYIMGLKEYEENGVIVIKRCKDKSAGGNRQPWSLIENTMYNLVDSGKLQGGNEDECFEVALKLVIVWVNRILFLKLLDGQLRLYKTGSATLKNGFMNVSYINSFAQLNSLFFNVLAVKEDGRDERWAVYGDIPYLNSSLFERSVEERTYNFEIRDISTAGTILYYENTVCKKDGIKRSGAVGIFGYLFEFLNSYDFSSTPKRQVTDSKRTLINAAVLGLIFEKINGYKDGSVFTPSFITQFMARDTVTRAVIKRFSEEYSVKCKRAAPSNASIEDVKEWCSLRSGIFSKDEARAIMNNIRILDMAVGSGHFLVSSLNTLICIKDELGLLMTADGACIDNIEPLKVENDTLLITTINGAPYTYDVNDERKRGVQEAIFNEKRTIIENNLFGVDINPNSVNICRLRLWIELLKNMYYTAESGYKRFETLPNIDINIKCGNSLLSNYDKDEIYKNSEGGNLFNDEVFTNIARYKRSVDDYKNESNKDNRRAIARAIENSKKDLIAVLDSIKASPNKSADTFEWLVEFAEVLNDDGTFRGFDVVIGNPPYIQLQRAISDGSAKKVGDLYEGRGYSVFERTGDIYCLFYEMGTRLLKSDGVLSFITSNKWMRAKYGKKTREFLSHLDVVGLIDFAGLKVFDEATVDTNILTLYNRANQKDTRVCIAGALKDKSDAALSDYFNKNSFKMDFSTVAGGSWVILNKTESAIKEKIERAGTPLKDWGVNINFGIKTGFNGAFIINEETRNTILKNCTSDAERKRTQALLKPILRGRDIKRYSYNWAHLYLVATHNGLKEKDLPPIDINDYPAVKSYLDQYWDRISKRDDKGVTPYNLRNCAYWEEFGKEKVVYSEIVQEPQFYLDKKAEFFPEATTFTITGSNNLTYLTGMLHSKAVTFAFKKYYAGGGLGDTGYRYKKAFMDLLPIPKPQNLNSQVVSRLEALTDKMLQNPLDSKTQSEIDKEVYSLYGLNENEVSYIEHAIVAV